MEPAVLSREKSCSSGKQNRVAGYNGGAMNNQHAWTLSHVLLATNGRFASGDSTVCFRSISIDTRSLKPGDLFLALSGDHFDGHQFLDEAVQKGAAGVLVEAEPEQPMTVPVVVVDDTLKALGDLAAYRRHLMNNLTVIAITGSSGKTTVKEMCAAIMEVRYSVLKTVGNFNNLIGMPLSLLPVEQSHEVAILEMGMNRSGEIARLTEIADPDIACIVNVQDAHLAGLSNIDGVARAKGELFEHGKSWARFCVNADDRRIKKMASLCSQKKIQSPRQ